MEKAVDGDFAFVHPFFFCFPAHKFDRSKAGNLWRESNAYAFRVSGNRPQAIHGPLAVHLQTPNLTKDRHSSDTQSF